MTNLERQSSLVKKHGTTGKQDYCEFCTYHFSLSCFGFKGIVLEQNPCAVAYNRMRRNENGKEKRVYKNKA